jgi:membrane protease YdiL (CAAX protease family)
MAVRIPVGTALAEELAFRGALLGLSLNHRSWLRSIAWTSALFGVWHVLPTLNTLESNPVGRLAVEAGHHRHAVLFNVAAMTAAGVLFALLRAATGSIVAPVIAHATANAAAYAAARRAVTRRVTEIGDLAVEVSHEPA